VNVPRQSLTVANDAQNNAQSQVAKDPRPRKRRRGLAEHGENAVMPQVAEAQARLTSEPSEGTLQRKMDDEIGEPETSHQPKQSSKLARPQVTSAFQKYATENRVAFQLRKAHWSTCSMELWLAGGEEIVGRFSLLFERGVSILETDIHTFESVDQSFERHKGDVLDNRDEMLRQAKDAIIVGSGPFLSDAPGSL